MIFLFWFSGMIKYLHKRLKNVSIQRTVFEHSLRQIIRKLRAQWLINLEIPVLVRSLKSSNVEFSYYLDGRLFKCFLSVAANP